MLCQIGIGIEEETLDVRGMSCTLYPISWQGAAVAVKQVDFDAVAQTFQATLVAELARAGLDLRMPVPGMPDQPLVIRGQVVRADPGSRLMRYLFTWLAGAAVFEAEGQVGDAAVLYGGFHAKGTRRAGFGGGDSQAMLVDAAKLAGQDSARQILATLAMR
jgi:hypothetical protein